MPEPTPRPLDCAPPVPAAPSVSLGSIPAQVGSVQAEVRGLPPSHVYAGPSGGQRAPSALERRLSWVRAHVAPVPKPTWEARTIFLKRSSASCWCSALRETSSSCGHSGRAGSHGAALRGPLTTSKWCECNPIQAYLMAPSASASATVPPGSTAHPLPGTVNHVLPAGRDVGADRRASV